MRRLLSATVICVVGGLLGGLALGYLLSRQGAWLTPVPWAVYLVALLAAIGAVTWLDERRRLRAAEAAWPLPPGFMIPEAPGQAAVEPAEGRDAGVFASRDAEYPGGGVALYEPATASDQVGAGGEPAGPADPAIGTVVEAEC